MFNKNFKLIYTAIGLVAVLVMGLAMPGVTQQNPLSRASVVGAINNAVAATLTAAEGDIWDTDNARFYSDPRATFVYIPLHPASRSLRFLEENVQLLLTGDDLNVTIAAFHIPEDIPSFILKAGTYSLKLMNRYKAVFVNQEGRAVFVAKVQVDEGGKFNATACPTTLTVINPNGKIVIKIFCVCEIIVEW